MRLGDGYRNSQEITTAVRKTGTGSIPAVSFSQESLASPHLLLSIFSSSLHSEMDKKLVQAYSELGLKSEDHLVERRMNSKFEVAVSFQIDRWAVDSG